MNSNFFFEKHWKITILQIFGKISLDRLTIQKHLTTFKLMQANNIFVKFLIAYYRLIAFPMFFLWYIPLFLENSRKYVKLYVLSWVTLKIEHLTLKCFQGHL